MSLFEKFIYQLTRRQRFILICLCGFIVGGGLGFLYLLRFHTYAGDDPAACMNCHIMQPYYATWDHSSHARTATCNDCHVPHENFVRKYAFKAKDGMKHTAAFITFNEAQAPAAENPSAQVIMNNCIRCHSELTTELVKLGKIDYMMAKTGKGKACWDCHRDVPHGGRNSLSSTPNSIVPFPPSPIEAPDWLKKTMKKKIRI